jgi:putative intracellular protease/amidase
LAAGFTVDFVSPQGGAVPIHVNYAGEHRDHFYNADLMYALKHSLQPAQIDPARYRAVYFVGGSNLRSFAGCVACTFADQSGLAAALRT